MASPCRLRSTGIERQHEPPRIVGDPLQAEIAEKHARSIKYQMTIAKLPLAKDIDDFAFESTPINERLVRDLAGGGFLEQQRNCVLVGGTGTGKTHLAMAIARSCIRAGKRGRFFDAIRTRHKAGNRGPGGPSGTLSRNISPEWTSSSSMNSVICPSLNRAGSCSSI